VSSQRLERTTTTELSSGKVTGLLTEPPDPTLKTAPSPSLITGRVPNNALNPGSAEVPDSAKEVDGALDMMAAKVLLFQTKPPACLWITEK
jgi:hypothetical protein